MWNLLKIGAFLTKLYDRIRVWFAYRRGRQDAIDDSKQGIEDIRDLIHSDDPVSVSDDELVKERRAPEGRSKKTGV